MSRFSNLVRAATTVVLACCAIGGGRCLTNLEFEIPFDNRCPTNEEFLVSPDFAPTPVHLMYDDVIPPVSSLRFKNGT